MASRCLHISTSNLRKPPYDTSANSNATIVSPSKISKSSDTSLSITPSSTSTAITPIENHHFTPPRYPYLQLPSPKASATEGEHYSPEDFKIKISLINARSLKNKMRSLRLFTELHVPDVILITESWGNHSIPNSDFLLLGYSLFRRDRHYGIGGGCLIYVLHKHKASSFEPTLTHPNVEDIWISLNANSLNILLGCIYISPSNSSSSVDYLTDLFPYFSSLMFDSILVGGDFNQPEIIWYPELSAPTRLKPILSAIDSLGWIQHVQSPTRATNFLDLIFTLNVSDISVTTGPLFPGSDHLIVSSHLNFKHQPNTKLIKFRSLSSLNWDNFRTLIRSLSWDECLIPDSTNSAVDAFYNNILHSLNVLAPINTSTTIQKKFSQDSKLTIYKRKIRRLKQAFRVTLDPSLLVQISTITESLAQQESLNLLQAETAAMKCNNKVSLMINLLNKRSPVSSNVPAFI